MFIEKKHSRPAIPEFLNNIPQLTLNGNEKLVLSCPESFPPGETMSSVDTPITVTGGASHNDPAAGSEIESHAHPATILSADTQPETVGKTFTTLASTSTVDSVNTIPVGSSPRTTRLAGESSQQEHVEERVTKKVATFYNSEIRFNWELPYLKCQRPAKVAVRNLYKPCQDNGGVYEIGFWVCVACDKFLDSIYVSFRYRITAVIYLLSGLQNTERAIRHFGSMRKE